MSNRETEKNRLKEQLEELERQEREEMIEYHIENTDYSDLQDKIKSNLEDEVKDYVIDNIYWEDQIFDVLEHAANKWRVQELIESLIPPPEPQGNLAFLKGALVCLTRYINSIEGVEEE